MRSRSTTFSTDPVLPFAPSPAPLALRGCPSRCKQTVSLIVGPDSDEQCVAVVVAPQHCGLSLRLAAYAVVPGPGTGVAGAWIKVGGESFDRFLGGHVLLGEEVLETSAVAGRGQATPAWSDPLRG